MDVKVHKLPTSTVELMVEASPDELKAHEDRALRSLASKLQLPGFRPGKVPLSLARKHLDPAKLLAAVVDLAVPQLYAKAVIDNKLETIGPPQIQILKIAPGNPLVFRATAAILPEFKLPDYRKVRVEQKKAEVTDDQVERLIRDLRRDRANEKTVDRAAAKGDVAVIDFDITQNKVPIERGQGREQPLLIGDEAFVPGFEDNLIGLKAGDEKDFSLKFPDDYGAKVLAGKIAEVHVKVRKVNERIQPELDDAFAKQVGQFASMTDLRTQLKKNMQLDAEAREQERYEGEVLKKLAGQTTVEVPDPLLQGELDKMARELEGSLARQGANLQDYLTSIKKSLDELKKGWVEQAKQRIVIGLLLRAIAKEEEIKVEDSEVQDEVNATLKQNPGNVEVEKTVRGKPYQDYVREIVRNRKTIELLSSLAQGKTPADSPR
ncbi:MAG: trigger factor [Candidatus Andersenbacteria bacterium]